MSDRDFRIFAKKVVAETRNYELNEVHEAIKKSTIRQFKTKFNNWDIKGRLFPR